MTDGSIAALPAHDTEGRLLAVIEAPRGSSNKVKFDPATGVFFVHKVLPPGTVFPFDFGFVPATLGADGDPLDVLVLMDQPAVPGVAAPCRLGGMIEAVQRRAKDTRSARGTRNDRLIAVADGSHRSRAAGRCAKSASTWWPRSRRSSSSTTAARTRCSRPPDARTAPRRGD